MNGSRGGEARTTKRSDSLRRPRSSAASSSVQPDRTTGGSPLDISGQVPRGWGWAQRIAEQALVHSQKGLCVMSYSGLPETSNFRSGTVGKRAREPRSRAALQRRFRDAPMPNPSGERPRELSPEDSRNSRVRLADGPQRHPRLQRAWTRRPYRRLLDSEARVRGFRRGVCRGSLRSMLHRSPREFGRESSLWTLEMAAEVAFEGQIAACSTSPAASIFVWEPSCCSGNY